MTTFCNFYNLNYLIFYNCFFEIDKSSLRINLPIANVGLFSYDFYLI